MCLPGSVLTIPSTLRGHPPLCLSCIVLNSTCLARGQVCVPVYSCLPCCMCTCMHAYLSVYLCTRVYLYTRVYFAACVPICLPVYSYLPCCMDSQNQESPCGIHARVRILHCSQLNMPSKRARGQAAWNDKIKVHLCGIHARVRVLKAQNAQQLL